MNDSRAIVMAKIAAVACAIGVMVAVPMVEASAAESAGSGAVVTPQPATPNNDPWI
jgi:hypothetical protein